MTIHTVLQLDDSTDGLTTLVDHLKSLRDLSYLHGIHHFGHLLRQLLHLELRRDTARLHIGIRHQTLVITRILVIRQQTSGLLKGELFFADISCNRVQTINRFLNSLIRNHRLLQNMTHVDLVTTLLHKLDNMETKLRLHNLRDLLRISEIEGHSSKGGIKGSTTHQA